MDAERIIVYCPDQNIRLSIGRLASQPTGGGKAAILRLAAAWADMGHQVTVACALAEEGQKGGLRVTSTPPEAQENDVAIFVTGARGHFGGWEEPGKKAWRKIFWINGPNRVQPPQLELDWVVAPSHFLALRAVAEWGFPPEKVVTVRGEAASPRLRQPREDERNHWRGIFASHPTKGLAFAIELMERLRPTFPQLELDVYGSERLWGDNKQISPRTFPPGVRYRGELPSEELCSQMHRYGFMPYLSPIIDGFSSATAEAMAAGLVVFASAHGSNAELIAHGWNGFLVPMREEKPDLEIAERLLYRYASNPYAFAGIRQQAAQSIPTWEEQARQWREVWRSPGR